MSELYDLLKMDLAWFNCVDGKPVLPKCGWGGILKRLLLRKFRAVFLYRLAHRAHARHHGLLAMFLGWWMWKSCGCEISPAASIGGGLRLPHPQGVIIGDNVEIGEMTRIGQHVTIGGNAGKIDEHGRARPRIGKWGRICAGSIVAGPIELGDNVFVGVNSVVLRSVPANAVVVGAPARIIRMQDPLEHDLSGSQEVSERC